MSHGRRHLANKLALAAVLAVASALLVTEGPTVSASTAMLVGRWHLNEATGGTTGDSSGYENNGIVVGARRIKGRFGNAFSFEEGKYVQVPNSPVLEPATISVEAWVRADTTATFRYVLAKGSTAAPNYCRAASYALRTTSSGGLEFYIRVPGDQAAHASPAADDSVWDGSWHHVVGTYDLAWLRLYVDGVEIGSGVGETDPIEYGLDRSNDLFIGVYEGHISPPAGSPCSVPNFVGSIDEVRVWDGALTANEVAQHARSNSAAP